MHIRRIGIVFAAAALAGALSLGALAVCVLGADAAQARGALIFDQDACVLKIGPDIMYFAGYSPQTPRKHFCEDAPTIGETIFTLDFAQAEMREMTTDFRIARDIGEDASSEALVANTVAFAPPRRYPAGTVMLQHNFTEPGDYVGVVTVDGAGGEHWEARFPFAVAPPLPRRTPYYLMTAAAIMAGILFLWNMRGKRA
jgi:hypothetical protein